MNLQEKLLIVVNGRSIIVAIKLINVKAIINIFKLVRKCLFEHKTQSSKKFETTPITNITAKYTETNLRILQSTGDSLPNR